MADFLTRLSQRVLGSADLLQPSTPSLFTPGSIQSGGLEAEPAVVTSARHVARSNDAPSPRAVSPAASRQIERGEPERPATPGDSDAQAQRPASTLVPTPSISESLHGGENRVQRRTGNVAGAAADAKGGGGNTGSERTQQVLPQIGPPRSGDASNPGTGTFPPVDTRAVRAQSITSPERGGNDSRPEPASRHQFSRAVADNAFDRPRLLVPVEVTGFEANTRTEQTVLSNVPDEQKAGETENNRAVDSGDSRERQALRERRAIEPLLPPTPPTVISQPVQAAPTPVPQAPTIQVSIGRIDIRATYPAPTERQRPAPQQPSLTLDAYLRQQNGRRS